MTLNGQRLAGAAKRALLALSLVWPLAASADTVSEWQALLERIVNINSGTQNVAGLDAVRAVLIPEFEKLGLEATTYDLGDGHKLSAMSIPDAAPELLLMGHIDTVFPSDSSFQAYARKGNRIYGPGVIDMKAGIVMMLELAKTLGQDGLLSKVLVVISDDEEIGSPFSSSTTKRIAGDIKAGLIFEPGLPDGAVVTSQSGVRWLNLSVKGQAAHAGMEPEKGLNACVELSHKVVEIAKLTDLARKLSVNVGVIEGGIKPNVVCDQAKARIDLRFVGQDDVERTVAAIQRIADRSYVNNDRIQATTTAALEQVVSIPSLPGSATERLFALLQAAGREIGQQVTGQHAGFVSDANQLAGSSMDLLVGLGPYGGGMHTTDEYLEISTFEERLELSQALVQRILQ